MVACAAVLGIESPSDRVGFEGAVDRSLDRSEDGYDEAMRALSRAVEAATAAGQWDAVVRLAEELRSLRWSGSRTSCRCRVRDGVPECRVDRSERSHRGERSARGGGGPGRPGRRLVAPGDVGLAVDVAAREDA
jgi:hypothetical protein